MLSLMHRLVFSSYRIIELFKSIRSVHARGAGQDAPGRSDMKGWSSSILDTICNHEAHLSVRWYVHCFQSHLSFCHTVCTLLEV